MKYKITKEIINTDKIIIKNFVISIANSFLPKNHTIESLKREFENEAIAMPRAAFKSAIFSFASDERESVIASTSVSPDKNEII